MANFKTHFQFATIGSGLAATAFLAAEILSPAEAFLCWIMGTVGGILPDIDSDNSHSLSILFGAISVVACFFTALYWVTALPLLWVWAACALTFILVQFGVRYIFERFTVHRGIFHSLLAGVFFMFFVVVAADQLGADNAAAWFLGLFTAFGYFLHLLLDEIYSVDFMNVTIKRSFGSAVKVWDARNVGTTLAMTAATIAVFMATPSHYDFTRILFDPATYSLMWANIFWA